MTELTAILNSTCTWILRASLLIAVLCICLALVRPIRSWLGARRAYLLWTVLPIGLATLLLPGQTKPAVSVQLAQVIAPLQQSIQPVVDQIQPVTSGIAVIVWMLVWLVGILVALTLYVPAFLRWQHRMLLAPDSPAVVGILRPTIVLPANFDTEYTPAQQQLILAHEQAHIAHRDPLWNVLFAILHAVFWFHPLMLWAHRAFRFDQELACDAAALAKHPTMRQTYAAALVQCNTQSKAAQNAIDKKQSWHAFGCQWQNSHPLVERIRMLKDLTQNSSRSARARKSAVTSLLLLLLSGLAFAIGTSTTSPVNSSPQYWIAMTVDLNGKNIASPTVLIGEGETAEVRVDHDEKSATNPQAPKLRLQITPSSASQGRTMLQLKASTGMPEQTLADPSIKIAGAGSIRFEHAGVGTYSVNFAVREAGKDSKTPPTDLKVVQPSYPKAAFEAEQHGVVVVRAKLDSTGRVSEAEVESANPAGIFEESALSAVRSQSYNVNSGDVKEGWVLVPVRFKLDPPAKN